MRWSVDRPLWQRDALRRLVASQNIGDLDVRQLTELCLAPHGFDTGVTPEPLASHHLPANGNTKDVRISAVLDIESVDVLSEGQCLSVAEQGLTVVYGRNRSGKSGYTRILKQLCRARACVPLRANVFDKAADHSRATIEYSVDGAACTATAGVDTEVAALRHVSVFDAECGALLHSRDNEVLYRPYGLHVLEELAEVADRVRGEIERQIALLHAERPSFAAVPDGTAAARFLAELSGDTPEAAINEAASFDDADNRRFNVLTTTLAPADPRAAAAAIERQASRFRALRERLEEIDGLLGREATARLHRIYED